MEYRFNFIITLEADAETKELAWKKAIEDFRTNDQMYDLSYEVCMVCGFPIDHDGEKCMCDDAVHGDTVHILDDPCEFRWVFDKGAPEHIGTNCETPESIKRIRTKGGIRFLTEEDLKPFKLKENEITNR